MIANLAELLRPHDPALLEAAMRERRPLHLKTGRGKDFARLLPWEQFNTLPTTELLMADQMRVVRRGKDTLLDMAVSFDRKRGRPRRVSARGIHGLCDQGMSLAVSHVDRLVPAIRALALMVERHFRASVSTNCYASFRDESAFRPHFDEHDVLAIQVHGVKRWYRHGQPYHAPVPGARFPAVKPPPPVEEELLMEPGDLLFLPRGEIHWARLEAASSMHLTFGITPRKGRDVLRWLAGLAEAHDVAREDITMLESPAERVERAGRLRAMLHMLADSIDLDAFLEAADREREQTIQPFNLGLMQELAGDTLVMAALRRRVPLGDDFLPKIDEDESTVLAFLLVEEGHTLDALVAALPELGPERVRAAVRGLASKALVFLFAAS